MANEVITTDAQYGMPTTGMAPGLAIMFNDALYDRCKQIAGVMARSEGILPPHLIGKSEACFAVVVNAITWKLNPFMVAQSTYSVSGKVGYEGRLVQAILENSGQLVGGVKFEHIGDWSKIEGKWKKVVGEKGKPYAVSEWKDTDEAGLGVIVTAQVRGEIEPRSFTMWLRECFPRNSTLWPTRPKQQICYTAVRAFANVAMPGIFIGIPFSQDFDGLGGMQDITPVDDDVRPSRADYIEKAKEASRAEREAAKTAKDASDEIPKELLPDEAEKGPVEGGMDSTDDAPEFSHADAHNLGVEARDAGVSLFKVPADLSPEFQETWKAGWRERDEAIADDKKAERG